jgi:glycosyltransferase involved in cell wall biosynthesis
VENGISDIESAVSADIKNYVLVSSEVNLGCSLGRNLGAEHASGKYIVFVDDDGVPEDDAIDCLITTIESHGAIAVRGKVVPRTPESLTPPHYDRGDLVVPSVPDAEGISVWDRVEFQRFGGFDGLLAGHEGLHLMCRMFRFHGPYAFLYTPDAVLHHDFNDSKAGLQQKERRQAFNRSYLDYCGLDWESNFVLMDRIAREPAAKAAFSMAPISMKLAAPNRTRRTRSNGSDRISVITTAKNAGSFLQDYTASLKNQTHQNFEVVFVDDGSEDETVKLVKEQWRDDDRLKLIESRHIGRSAALNLAFENAECDICVIADADDISLERRLEWTANYFESHPNSLCLSFVCFSDSDFYRAARPLVSAPVSIRARSLVGMPVVFPTFACRRVFFQERFDERLTAGVDCDWVYRNLRSQECDGHLVPIPAVYYRVHDDQITSTKRGKQREVALRCIRQLHEAILDKPVDQHEEELAKLSGWTPLESGSDLTRILDYVCLLERALARKHAAACARDFSSYLHLAWKDLLISRMQWDYAKLKTHHEALTRRRPKAPDGLGWRKVLFPLIRPGVKRFGTARDLAEYDTDPRRFFTNLTEPWHQTIGRVLFPPD